MQWIEYAQLVKTFLLSQKTNLHRSQVEKDISLYQNQQWSSDFFNLFFHWIEAEFYVLYGWFPKSEIIDLPQEFLQLLS